MIGSCVLILTEAKEYLLEDTRLYVKAPLIMPLSTLLGTMDTMGHCLPQVPQVLWYIGTLGTRVWVLNSRGTFLGTFITTLFNRLFEF